VKASAEAVRLHVDRTYIRPARERGATRVRVAVKEVAKDLGYSAKYPLICTALRSNIFESEFRVRLASTDGPEQSSTTVLTFSVLS
jgi:5-methylcytosine-specific restriction enzyme B